YELGQSFCQAVAAERGASAMTAMWSAPQALPTLEELRDPQRWLLRVAA
ncbi:MAG: zinc-dependent metalloprotease, partial [Actinomycetota bacterium]